MQSWGGVRQRTGEGLSREGELERATRLELATLSLGRWPNVCKPLTLRAEDAARRLLNTNDCKYPCKDEPTA